MITDSVGGGELVLEAGASIVFDDVSGAGFDPEASFTVTIDGSSTAGCEVRSASLEPTNRWAWPALTIDLTATRCTFRGYATPFSAPAGWALNNCTFDYEIPAASPYSFTAWFPHRVSIEDLQGYGARGTPTYALPVVVDCYLNHKLQNVLGPDGNEVVSDSYLLVDGTVSVQPYARVTLPDGNKRPVKSVGSGNLPSGPTAIKVVYL